MRVLPGPLAATLLLLLAACAAPERPSDGPAIQPPPEPAVPLAYPRYPAQPLPADGRVIAEAREFPWSALGRVNTGGRGFCTGILIGPAQVLASAPCLYYGVEGRWWHPSEIHFVAGYQRDAYLADSAVAGYRVPESFKPGAGITLGNLTKTWALLTLAEPIGRRTGWLGLEALDKSLRRRLAAGAATLLEAGYRRDRPHVVLLNFGCGLAGPVQGVPGLAPDCRRLAGDAGLPPLVFADGQVRAASPALAAAGAALTRALGAAGIRPPTEDHAPRPPTATVDQFLVFLGYLPSDPGLRAAERDAAIRAYQQRNGLAVDGRPSLELLEDLIRALQPLPPVS